MHLKAHLRSGKTLTFQLPQEFPRWQASQSQASFQSQLTGLCIVADGQTYALPPPVGFRSFSYLAEVESRPNGEVAAYRIGHQADDVQTTITVYAKNPIMIRMDTRKMGRQRWAAPGRAIPQQRDG